MGGGWVCDARSDIHDIVQKGHNVEKVTLRFSNEDNDITESQRVVEQKHRIVFERVQHLVGKVLLVPTRLLPFIIAVGRELMQRCDS